ncbi:MAG: hypothetical protein OXI54_12965 [Chloroflexota bacterium]|nr:hypothetical protein [Chloroflexota bacterium]MDE2685040.1 hypothetical protein [Chloroflexota bacterium]
MQILFDQGTPWPLRHYLAGHTIHRALQLGWDRDADGLLIARAEEAGYELLITTDQNIQYQQNLAILKIAILVLVDHNWPYNQASIDPIVAAVETATEGSYLEIKVQ